MNDAPTDDTTRLDQVIGRAQAGNPEALERLLAHYRPFLRLTSEGIVGRALQSRHDESDLVQDTMTDVYRKFDQFRGATEPEFSAWLRQILKRNLANLIRDNRAAKRDVRVEQSLDQDGSVSVNWVGTGSRDSPPRAVVRGEAALRVYAAIDALPPEQREAVRRRHLDGEKLNDIAAAMEITPGAVAGLIRRGMDRLRQLLKNQNDSAG